MTDPVFVATMSGSIGIISSLLTISITPTLQHYFWKRQRREEIRLAVVEEINRLAAEFITNHIADPNFRPSNEFHQSFHIVSAKAKVLFSQQAFQDFKNMEQLIGPSHRGMLGPMADKGVHDFIERRDIALSSFYREIGILTLPER